MNSNSTDRYDRSSDYLHEHNLDKRLRMFIFPIAEDYCFFFFFFFFFSSLYKRNIKKNKKQFHSLKYRKTVRSRRKNRKRYRCVCVFGRGKHFDHKKTTTTGYLDAPVRREIYKTSTGTDLLSVYGLRFSTRIHSRRSLRHRRYRRALSSFRQ